MTAAISAVPEAPGSGQPGPARKKAPSARSKARRRAVEVLFEAQQRGVDPVEVAHDTQVRLGFTLHPHTMELVRGVREHQADIDALMVTHSRDWPLDRMPAVDRAIVQVGTYELLAPTVTPASSGSETTLEQHKPPQRGIAAGVVISEAVALAALLSTEASPAFVNGLLDAIARATGESQ